MKYTMKMMGGDSFSISDETFKKLIGKTGTFFIPELNGIINLNSLTSIMPEDLIKKDRVKLHDGGYAVIKFNEWVDEKTGSKLLEEYYPYVYKETPYEEFIKLDDNRN